jgi:hypothetical protein
MPIVASAMPIAYDAGTLIFGTSGQSMWGSGESVILEDSRFLGATWDVEASIGDVTHTTIGGGTIPVPHIHLPSGWECHGFLCTSGHFHNPGGVHIHNVPLPEVTTSSGAEVEISTSGRVGFNMGLQLDSGSVAAQVEFDVGAVIPDDIQIGEFFNLNPSSALSGGSLDTNLAEVSAVLEAVIGARASIFGQVCAVAGCLSGTTSIGFDDQVLELLSFNESSPGEIEILDIGDPALFNFGSPISIPSPTNPLGEVGNATIYVPDINATGGVDGNSLKASGQDALLDLRVDLDGLLLAPLALPGLGVNVDVGIFSGSLDLIDVEIGPRMNLVQDFELTPTLWVDLAFSDPVSVAGLAGPVTQLRSRWDSLPDIALLSGLTEVTPTFFLDTAFTNNTLLGIDGVFQLDIVKAALSLAIGGISFDLAELGPLFQIFETANLFNTPPIFSNTYSLEGFNTITGPSFSLLSSLLPPIAVSEPGMLALLLLGSLALAGFRRRRPGSPSGRSRDCIAHR